METFTIDWGRTLLVRLRGRNPLVRRSDRIEALVLILAVVIVALAAPIAGAIGTSVHDARSRIYADEMRHRHQATATALTDGIAVARGNVVSFDVPAAWDAAGGVHTAVIRWPAKAIPGEQQRIWVDDHGEYINPPRSLDVAGHDAVCIAVSFWLAVAAGAGGFAYIFRKLLDRRRFAEWGREADSWADAEKD